MLISQAYSLDAIFGNLARRAVAQEYLPQYQVYLQLALKAQAQCRATLQTLVEVKYPRQTQFVRQQNVAVNQQVNNGSPEPSRARETEIEQSKPLEAQDGDRLDTRVAGATGPADPQLATLGAINWAKNQEASMLPLTPGNSWAFLRPGVADRFLSSQEKAGQSTAV